MNWKYLLVGGAFVGVFSLGALLSPLGESSANTNGQVERKLAVVQTASEKETSQAETGDSICPMTGEAMGKGARMGQHFAGSMQTVIAEKLGMTEDELQAARQDGKSVADLAKEKGVKVDDLVAAMVKASKADLEQLVKDGKMTQEQMDTMMKNMEAMMKTAIERDTVGPMNGHGRGMGMGQGGHMANGTANL